MTLDTAQQCRDNGWTIGTQLTADNNGYGPDIIEITAIGEHSILAKLIIHHGHQPASYCEQCWFLGLRNWTEVK